MCLGLALAALFCTADTGAPQDRRYRVCTVEAILDNCFTVLVFCGPSFFPLAALFFKTVNTMGGMEIIEKEGGMPVFDTDIINTFFFLPTAEITARLTVKIGAHLSATEGLIVLFVCLFVWCFYVAWNKWLFSNGTNSFT